MSFEPFQAQKQDPDTQKMTHAMQKQPDALKSADLNSDIHSLCYDSMKAAAIWIQAPDIGSLYEF